MPPNKALQQTLDPAIRLAAAKCQSTSSAAELGRYITASGRQPSYSLALGHSPETKTETPTSDEMWVSRLLRFGSCSVLGSLPMGVSVLSYGPPLISLF